MDFCPVCHSETDIADLEAHVNACLDSIEPTYQKLPETHNTQAASESYLTKFKQPVIQKALPGKLKRKRDTVKVNAKEPSKGNHNVSNQHVKLNSNSSLDLQSNEPRPEYASNAAAPQKLNERAVKSARIAPWYKWIKDTTFTMDAFSFSIIPGCTHYFLSHFHSDHYMGLTRKFAGDLYCTEITKRLIISQIKVDESRITALPMNVRVDIPNGGGCHVTLVDANHCPGAAIFLFELESGARYLHTGDFRASRDIHLKHPAISSLPLDIVYLDTTYCHASHVFPPQNLVVDTIVNVVTRCFQGEKIQKIINPKQSIYDFFNIVPRLLSKPECRILVVVGTYLIGKEKVFLGIAEALDCKIYAESSRRNVYGCMSNPRLSNRIIKDPLIAKVHAVPMCRLNPETLGAMLEKYRNTFDSIIAIKPTGWTFKATSAAFGIGSLVPQYYKDVTIVPLPYSEHSSYSELEMFCRGLKIGKIVPTVNVGSVGKMQVLFSQWI